MKTTPTGTPAIEMQAEPFATNASASPDADAYDRVKSRQKMVNPAKKERLLAECGSGPILSFPSLQEQLEVAFRHQIYAESAADPQDSAAAIYLAHSKRISRMAASYEHHFANQGESNPYRIPDPELEIVRLRILEEMTADSPRKPTDGAEACPHEVVHLGLKVSSLDASFNHKVYDPSLPPAENDLRGSSYLNRREEIHRLLEQYYVQHPQSGGGDTSYWQVRESLAQMITLKAATYRLELPSPNLQRLLEQGKLLPGRTDLPQFHFDDFSKNKTR